MLSVKLKTKKTDWVLPALTISWQLFTASDFLFPFEFPALLMGTGVPQGHPLAHGVTWGHPGVFQRCPLAHGVSPAVIRTLPMSHTWGWCHQCHQL